MATPYHQTMAAAFEDELQKIAAEKISMSGHAAKTLGLLGAGALGAEFIRRAERDRRMGRAVRMQNQGY